MTTDKDKWINFYSKDKNNVKHCFIKVKVSNGKNFFFKERDYKQWFQVKDYCEKNSLSIERLSLQFRSNECTIDLEDSDGVYLVRSAMGTIGQKTKHYLTVGLVKDNIVEKKLYVVPELILEKEYTDTLDHCFEEALILNEETSKNGKKQVQT